MTTKPDMINHPAHYGGADNPHETIKVLASWMTSEQLYGFCVGNAIKYLSRAGKKRQAEGNEDLDKARWYLNYLLERENRN